MTLPYRALREESEDSGFRVLEWYFITLNNAITIPFRPLVYTCMQTQDEGVKSCGPALGRASRTQWIKVRVERREKPYELLNRKLKGTKAEVNHNNHWQRTQNGSGSAAWYQGYERVGTLVRSSTPL